MHWWFIPSTYNLLYSPYHLNFHFQPFLHQFLRHLLWPKFEILASFPTFLLFANSFHFEVISTFNFYPWQEENSPLNLWTNNSHDFGSLGLSLKNSYFVFPPDPMATYYRPCRFQLFWILAWVKKAYNAPVNLRFDDTIPCKESRSCGRYKNVE